LQKEFSLSTRATGRIVAALGAVLCLGWAAYTGWTEAMPELHVYDGLWMLLGATIGVVAIAPLIWRWSRERSLAAVAGASILGSWIPLVLSAHRHHMPVLARVKGAWVLAGADTVSVAVPVGFVLLWLALREHTAPPNVPPS
jgi:hypothetical protein